MQSQKSKTVVYLLTLDEEEAAWLRTLVQNPIGTTPEDEDERNREFRAKLWKALERQQ